MPTYSKLQYQAAVLAKFLQKFLYFSCGEAWQEMKWVGRVSEMGGGKILQHKHAALIQQFTNRLQGLLIDYKILQKLDLDYRRLPIYYNTY